MGEVGVPEAPDRQTNYTVIYQFQYRIKVKSIVASWGGGGAETRKTNKLKKRFYTFVLMYSAHYGRSGERPNRAKMATKL